MTLFTYKNYIILFNHVQLSIHIQSNGSAKQECLKIDVKFDVQTSGLSKVRCILDHNTTQYVCNKALCVNYCT